MILHMVGKLAPDSTHFTRGLVKYVPGRGYFRAVPYQNGDKFATLPTPSFVERLVDARKGCVDSVYRKKSNSFGSGSYSPLIRSVEFLAIKILALWCSLTSVYPHSSHSLGPSDSDDSSYQHGF